MIKFIFIILLTNILYSDIITDISGNIEYSYVVAEDDSSNHIDIVINVDTAYDKHSFIMSPGVYVYDNSSYNSVINNDVNKIRAVYLNELYYSYRPINNLTLSVGLFPFRKGTFYEYSFSGSRQGIGTYSITDTTLQGYMLTYTINKHIIIIGSVAFEKFFTSYKDFDETSNILTFKSYTNSGMDHIAYRYRNDKIYLETRYMNIYQYVNDNKIIETDNFVLASSYNNEDVTGTILYSILSYSNSNGDNSSLSPLNIPFQTDTAYFDKFTSNGYYYLFGIKQEIDNIIFNRDLLLGFEYSYRSPGYHSLLAGMPVSTNSYGDIGYMYSPYIGVRLFKDSVIKFKYINFDSTATLKYGTSTITNNTEQHDSTKYILQFQYGF